MPKLTRRMGNALTAFACFGLLAFALYSQYVLELYPCPLCIFQRIAVAGLGLVTLIAALHNPARVGTIVYTALALAAGGLGVGIAARHVWLQNLPPDQVPACGAGLDYMLDTLPLTSVVRQVLTASGECAEVSWRLFGLTMPTWVVIAVSALLLWVLVVNTRLPRRTAPAL
ncbi:MAG: disulfide bond formation protein B [Pseudomonadota bacterium]